MVLLGILATACVIWNGLVEWGYPTSDPKYAGYALRRVGYTLATCTDVPPLQLLLAGLAVIIAAHRGTGAEPQATAHQSS